MRNDLKKGCLSSIFFFCWVGGGTDIILPLLPAFGSLPSGPGTPSYTHTLTSDCIQISRGIQSEEPDKVKRIYLIDVDGGLEPHSGVLGKRSREH